MANFRTRARAVDLLGKQQIRDEVTAISELLRNSYDADAEIGLIDVETENDRIVVMDDGDGMSESEILNNWLTLGTYSKKSKKAIRTRKGRVKIGEKGIGRLAISLLGDQLLLITKKRTQNNADEQWSLLYLHWELFRNESLYLEDIDIPVKSFSSFNELFSFLQCDFSELKKDLIINFCDPDKWSYESIEKVSAQINRFEISDDLLSKIKEIESNGGGTLFYINGIDSTWDWGVYKVQIEEENLLKRKQRLKDVLFSFQNFIDLFEQEINGDDDPESQDTDKKDADKFSPKIHIDGINLENETSLNPDDISLFDYALKGTIEDGEFIGQAFMGTHEPPGEVVVERNKLTSGMKQGRFQDCGPIKIKWFFVEGQDSCIPKEQHKMITDKLDKIGGLYVFRDGLRILPYGEPGNDFLNMEERRTKSAGRYLFSFRRMYGYIEISKELNPYLEDKSSREGFVENGFYEYFRTVLINLLLWWAMDYLGTTNKSGGRRGGHIQSIHRKNEMDENAILEKKMENQYFKQVDKFLVKFEEAIKSMEEQVVRKLNATFNSYMKEKHDSLDPISIQSKLLNMRIELFKYVEETETLKYTMNNRYNHSYDQIDGIEKCNREADNLKHKLRKYADSKLQEFLSALQDKTIITDPKKNFEALLQQVGEAIKWSTVTLPNLLSEIESRPTKLINGYMVSLKEQIDTLLSREIEANKILWGPTLESLKACSGELAHLRNSLLYPEDNSLTDDLIMKTTELLEQFHSIRENTGDLLTEYSDKLQGSETLLRLNSSLALTVEKTSKSDYLGYDNWYIGQLKKEIDLYRDLSAIGMAAEITAHEFNSLYASIREYLVQLNKIVKQPSEAALVERTTKAFLSLEKMYQRLSPLYRQSRNTRTDVNLHGFVNHILEYFSTDLERYEIEVINEIPQDLTLRESEVVLFTPLINVISNSIYWLLNQPNKRIHFYTNDNSELFIHDTGPGVDEKDIDHIFDPFFTKRAGGNGLGLFLSRDILRSKGNDLDLIPKGHEIKSVNGACFKISFINSNTK